MQKIELVHRTRVRENSRKWFQTAPIHLKLLIFKMFWAKASKNKNSFVGGIAKDKNSSKLELEL